MAVRDEYANTPLKSEFMSRAQVTEFT